MQTFEAEQRTVPTSVQFQLGSRCQITPFWSDWTNFMFSFTVLIRSKKKSTRRRVISSSVNILTRLLRGNGHWPPRPSDDVKSVLMRLTVVVWLTNADTKPSFGNQLRGLLSQSPHFITCRSPHGACEMWPKGSGVSQRFCQGKKLVHICMESEQLKTKWNPGKFWRKCSFSDF